LLDSAGDNCNLILGKLAGINPENQQSTAPADPNIMCNDCALTFIKTQLEMPLASNADLASGLSSVASSCQTIVSVSALPSASPPWVTTTAAVTATATAPPTASSSCVGETYVVKDGDTCKSVSQGQRIDTVQLLAANNLVASCATFPAAAGSKLCIPSALACEPYVVKSGDTCTSIANHAKATWAQIISWNPELGRSCQNVGRYVDYVVCVSNPGGSWIDPDPSATSTAGGVTMTPVEYVNSRFDFQTKPSVFPAHNSLTNTEFKHRFHLVHDPDSDGQRLLHNFCLKNLG
jgi:LysM repeat protein